MHAVGWFGLLIVMPGQDFWERKNICFVFYYLEKAFEKVPRRWFGRQCEGSKLMNGLLQVVKKM